MNKLTQNLTEVNWEIFVYRRFNYNRKDDMSHIEHPIFYDFNWFIRFLLLSSLLFRKKKRVFHLYYNCVVPFHCSKYFRRRSFSPCPGSSSLLPSLFVSITGSFLSELMRLKGIKRSHTVQNRITDLCQVHFGNFHWS